MNNICSVEGCNRPVKAKRLCGGHYQRDKRHGVIGGPLRGDKDCVHKKIKETERR